MDAVLIEGNLIAASTGGSIYGTVHGGYVHLVPEWRAYSLSPLCLRYVKANGERLVSHEAGRTPTLVRGFPYLFADVRAGRTAAERLCPHCVAVFDADQACLPVQKFVRLSHAVNRAMSRARGGRRDRQQPG